MDDTLLQQDAIYSYLRKYAKMGLPVIPCRGKIPLIKDWQNREVPTMEEIDAWVSDWPDLNIGLVLGAASRIVGIDVDGPEALGFLRELSKGALPITPAFKTPGGGKRYLFSIPEGITAKKFDKQFQGDHSELSFLGDGQQTILPPSIHPNGGVYRWYKGKKITDCPVSEAPSWMLDLMSRKNVSLTQPIGANSNSPKFPSDQVFKRLENHCTRFRDDHLFQKNEGLSEESWFLWVALLTAAGHSDAALDFSKLSDKHNGRSNKRLAELTKENKTTTPMTRCSTFGCSEQQIEQCFSQVNRNNNNEISNSPGTFIRDMTTVFPPSNPAYHPYIKALEKSDDYTIDESGNVCSYDRKGNPYPIANFVARPMLEVVRDDGESETRTFRIEGLLHGGTPLPAVDIAAADFVGMNWPLKSWGIQASIKPGFGTKDQVRDAIQNSALVVPEHRIYTHMGWRRLSYGTWVYLHNGGAIGATDVSVEIDSRLARYTLPEVVDLKSATSASIDLLKVVPHRVSIPLLALVYLAPLVDPFKRAGLEPTFLLWLHGTTGSQKTSLALVMLCHFGMFAGKNPPASFKDTANSIEMRAFSTKDSLLLIDDFHPTTSTFEGKNIAQTAQKLLRMYGDRIGRGRLKSSIEFQREYPPRGMALVTGEDLPIGQSSVARFLGIELEPGKVNLEKLTHFQNNSQQLAEAMTGYIEWLRPQMENLPNRLAKEFSLFREQFQSQAIHGRLGEAAAWLEVAFSLFLEYAQDVKALKSNRAEVLRKKSINILSNLVTQQGRLVDNERPADIFVKTLWEMFNSGKAAVQPIRNGYIVPDIFSCGEPIGWVDEQHFYLLPEATYNAISVFLQKRGDRFPLKPRATWKQLDEAGLIYTEIEDTETRRLVKKSIPSTGRKKSEKRYRLLHVKRHEFEQLCET